MEVYFSNTNAGHACLVFFVAGKALARDHAVAVSKQAPRRDETSIFDYTGLPRERTAGPRVRNQLRPVEQKHYKLQCFWSLIPKNTVIYYVLIM